MPDKFKILDRPGSSSRSALIVAFSLLVTIFTVTFYALRHPQALDLQYNPYAVLSFLPIAINIWIIILIVRLRTQSEEAVWFVLYLCGITIAGLGEALQRMSAQPDAAVFWFQLNGLGFMLMPIAYYLFVFSYVKPLRSQSPLLVPSLMTGLCVMILFFVGTNQFYNLVPSAMVSYPWGFNPPTGPLFGILFLWVELLLLVAFFTLFRFYRRVSSDLLRRQSRVYIWAILIPIIGGSITDGLLPLLNYNSIVPLSIFLSTGTSVVAYYGLRRYRLFQVNPSLFAENVIRTMHEAVVVTNTQFKIDFANREAQSLLHANSANLSGTDISTYFTPDSWQTILQAEQNEKRGMESLSEADFGKLTIMDTAGNNIPIRIYTSRLEEGTPNEAYIFIISDISDITASYHQLEDSAARIRTQNQLLQENQVTMERLLAESQNLQKQLQHEKENVEHTVEVRTAELREARDKLEAADELKSEFIMLSSHNLRTPLSIMRSSVELLADNPSLAADQKAIIHSLTNGTDRLGELIEDLLTIATLEAGDQSRLEPTKLGDIISPLVSEAESIAESKGLVFKPSIPTTDIVVNANAPRLRGAIRNILHNAVNFTTEGEVRLRVSTSENKLRIIVEDSGIGIPPEELPKLFTKFHRATSTLVYDYQGKGIGLYLAKLVVEEHNGKIFAESTLGKGSAFTMELPIIVPGQSENSIPASVATNS
ncbi:MAG: amtb 2 [Candidatus Saccharibacteria bacterium]|nr:amtb 2 [Candidatus Saccharibacteria bacterium]